MKSYYVYIITSRTGTLYIGVTSNLQRRVYQHKEKVYEGFTKKYDVDKLVYFEIFQHPNDAITREKQLKRWNRAKKKQLIESMNPTWQDLSGDWYE